jgi:heptosyltransferase II
MRDFHNIIVRMPNWLGDAVMATPIIADLKSKWPKCCLTAMCQGAVSALLLGNPHLDEIFSFSQPNEFERRMKRNLILRLRQGKYDLGILLPNSFSSAWWFWRGHVEQRIGFASDWRSFLLSHAIDFPKIRGKEHLVETYKRLLAPLRIPISDTKPQVFISKEEREAAKELLIQRHAPKGVDIVGINPGAAYGSAKCWLPERFREVMDKILQKTDAYILCFGDKAGTDLAHRICEGMPSRVINLAGQTNLRELIALIDQCTVFLTNDSGPMHIAAALKKPLVALFGSTNEIATGPYQHGRIIHKHVDCSPCYKRTCPIDFRCMTRIESEEVFQALFDQLQNLKKTDLAYSRKSDH